VKRLGHAALGREAAVDGELIGFHRDDACTVVGIVLPAGPIHGDVA
jgi:hypothetical protein